MRPSMCCSVDCGPDMSRFASRLDAATAVLDRGDGLWSATIHDGWDVLGVTNGGYLTAILSGAMTRASDRPDPITLTTHFLSRASIGAADVRVEVLREGRRFATVQAQLIQRDRIVAQALGSFGDLSVDVDGPDIAHPMADIPPFDACIASTGAGTTSFPTPAIAEQVGLRINPHHVGFAMGAPHGVAEISGWSEFPDGRTMDTHAALVIADAFPPPIFNSGLPLKWTPTVELTVHLHRRPTGTRMAAAFRSDHVTGGYIEEDGVMWDESGALVAVSRQLALVGT